MNEIVMFLNEWMKSMEKVAIIVGAAVMIVVIPLQAAERAMEDRISQNQTGASVSVQVTQ